MSRTAILCGVCLALLVSPASALAQNVHLAVIVGLAGDPEHAESFQKWGSSLVDAATKRYGITPDRITYLAAAAEGAAPRGRSSREEIVKAFDSLVQKAARWNSS